MNSIRLIMTYHIYKISKYKLINYLITNKPIETLKSKIMIKLKINQSTVILNIENCIYDDNDEDNGHQNNYEFYINNNNNNNNNNDNIKSRGNNNK